MSKQFWGVIAAVVIIFAAIFALSSPKTDKNSSGKLNGAQPTQHIKGNASSEVKLVEYGDFQCPYCEQYEATIEVVTEIYKDKVSFQFRNFPLVNNHPNAFAAARAAEAAGLQNKYWEMHDTLYRNANWQAWTITSTPTVLFDSYTAELGLNAAQFKADYSSSKVNDLINADMAAGNKLNITGTPSFFLNGKQIQVANSVEAFKKVIDAEVAKHKTASTNTSTTTTPSPSTTQ